jgi:hypothetical protein
MYIGRRWGKGTLTLPGKDSTPISCRRPFSVWALGAIALCLRQFLQRPIALLKQPAHVALEKKDVGTLPQGAQRAGTRLRSQPKCLQCPDCTALARQRADPPQFTSLLRLAEIGISARTAREIYGRIDAATLGGCRAAATQAGVPAAMIAQWEKEMIQQTLALRDNAKATAKPSGRKN